MIIYVRSADTQRSITQNGMIFLHWRPAPVCVRAYLADAGGGAGDEDDLAGDVLGEDGAEEVRGHLVHVVRREDERQQRRQRHLQRCSGQPAAAHHHHLCRRRYRQHVESDEETGIIMQARDTATARGSASLMPRARGLLRLN